MEKPTYDIPLQYLCVHVGFLFTHLVVGGIHLPEVNGWLLQPDDQYTGTWYPWYQVVASVGHSMDKILHGIIQNNKFR